MRVLAVGDKFIPARWYADAIRSHPDLAQSDVVMVEWAGTKTRQHELQQVMEVQGASALDAPPELLGPAASADVICMHFAPVGRELIDAAPHLKLIAVARAGLENVDVAAATARSIGVVPSYGRNAGAVAELQIGLMLAEARNIARADASVKVGGWRKEFPGPAVEIAGRTVGMVGFGHVGQVFADRLGGFGPRLLAYDPYASPELLAKHGVQACASIDEVFSDSHFVVIQVRHTPETDRFIRAEHFDLMGPGAYFINVARSRVVDNDALYEALAAGRIAGAGLDVFDEEPLLTDSRWRALDNVTITTHFGGDTEDTNRTSAALVAAAIAEFATTGRVSSAVNAEKHGWA